MLITEGLGPESGGGGGGPLTVSGVLGVPLGIEVTLSANGALTGDSLLPSKWVVTAGGVPLTVSAVQIAGTLITLTTNEATDGASYTLSIPQGIADLSSGNPCLGPFVWNFTGDGIAPTAFMAQTIDGRHVRVIFSEPVRADDATVAANYSIDNGLTVSAVSQETDRNYVLTTSLQVPSVFYTITITNVRDLAGNPV